MTFVDPLAFVARVAKPAPPTPIAVAPPELPPAPPEPAPKVPSAAATPIARPDQRVRREFRAPREVPTEVPKEADPSPDEGGVARGGVAGGTVGGVIDLPDDAVPPRLMPGNAVPPYPPEARAERRSGTVILKVIVYANGSVGDVRVVDGDEPFVRAAVAAVRTWRYEPARWRGQPIAVYREIRIPFRLTTG